MNARRRRSDGPLISRSPLLDALKLDVNIVERGNAGDDDQPPRPSAVASVGRVAEAPVHPPEEGGPRLWVKLRDGLETFIVGETYTFPGRFVIGGDNRPRNCSQSELAQVSVESALWLSGYLHASVPRPPEDQKLMKEWTEKRGIFLRSGAWPGRRDYTTVQTGHSLSITDEVLVQPQGTVDGDLDAARGCTGVIVDCAFDDQGVDDVLRYLVMLDETDSTEAECWVIAEEDLAVTGRQRPDYEPDPHYECACCGFLTLHDQDPGSYEICKVCLWEADEVQLRDPDLAGGANRVSLHEARATFRGAGVSELRFKDNVRRPTAWEYPRPEVVGPDGRPASFTWPRLP